MLRDEARNLLFSRKTIKTIENSRWAVHVAFLGDTVNSHRISVGQPEGGNHLAYVGLHGSTIFQWMLRKTA